MIASDETIAALARANPAAVLIQDSDGDNVLRTLAVISPWPWLHCRVFLGTTAPMLHSRRRILKQAVGRKDNVTGLHAFMLAASAPFQNEVDHVDTVFNLLRLDPSVIEGHSRRSKKKESSSKKRTGTRANIEKSLLSGGRKKARQLQT